jgi:hypothetical protein
MLSRLFTSVAILFATTIPVFAKLGIGDQPPNSILKNAS